MSPDPPAPDREPRSPHPESKAPDDVRQEDSGPDEEVGQDSARPPFGDPIDFNLSMPPIEVRMVSATALEDYEIWVFAASLVFSGFVGFFVAYFQTLGDAASGTPELIVSILLGLFFVLTLTRVRVLRKRLSRESRTYPMRAVAAGPSNPVAEEATPPDQPV